VKAKDVRHISVPYYESLTLNRISNFLLDGHSHVFQYMPDRQEIHKVNKEWICNICASVLKNIFTDWVKLKIQKRNEDFVEKRELGIELDPDVAEAFNASTAVSGK